MSLARSTWTSSNCRPASTGTSARRVDAGQQHVVAAAPPRPAAGVARLAQRVAEQDMGGGAAAAGIARALLAQLDILERPRAGDRLHVAAEIDDRALAARRSMRAVAGETTARVTPAGAADRDRRASRIDRRGDVDRGVERRRVRLRVVGRVDRVDLDQADPREAGDDARRHPFAAARRRPARPPARRRSRRRRRRGRRG